MSVDRLPNRFSHTCRDLIPAGSRVLVAVSGGADSLALLHLLTGMAAERGWTLAIAHFNHRQDPTIDDAAVTTLRSLAASLALPFHTAAADLPEGCAENRLRQARYAFLADTAAAWGASHVAVAHHADDQAETLLLRLLRGAVAGLGGMRASRPLTRDNPTVQLVRPLLGIPRRDLTAYGDEHGLVPIADPSNDDLRFRRNRVRQTILPLLESAWPGLRPILTRTARWLREDDDLLQTMAASVVADLPPPPDDLPIAVLQAQPGPIRRRILRTVLAARGGPAVSSTDLAALEAVISGERTGAGLPGGWQARRHGGFLSVSRSAAGPSARPTVPFRAQPGTQPLPGWPLQVTIRPAADDDQDDAWQIRLPAGMAADGCHWRPLQPGDRLATHAGRLKVGELLRQCGHSPSQRREQLVLADDTGVLWVVGVRRSDRLAAPVAGEPAWLVHVARDERPDH
jgi:tRNA(Ile)-lysidine synthase